MVLDIRFKIVKWVDHWIGSIMCVVLGIIHRITHPWYRDVPRISVANAPKNILVIKFFGLGSILLSSPLLRSIKNKYPASKITFLTLKYNADLVKQLQLSQEVRMVDTRNAVTFFYSAISNLVYFSFHKPEISIDIEFFSKFSTMMAYLSGAKWRIGFYMADFWRSSLVNVPVHFNYARHILEIYKMVGEAIGTTVVTQGIPMIPVAAEEESFVKNLLYHRGIIENDFLLGVNINASDLAFCRRWPRERFADVINMVLKENKDVKAILTGGKNEKEYVSFIVNLLDNEVKGRVFNLSAHLNFRQFIALLNRINLFLTCDSGPFHLAKAQGIPTISIWGPGSPDLYGPYGEEKKMHKVVYKGWNCSPCMYIYRTNAGFFCKNATFCLHAIGSQEVAKQVNDSIFERHKVIIR